MVAKGFDVDGSNCGVHIPTFLNSQYSQETILNDMELLESFRF